MTLPPDFMKQFESHDEAEITQAHVFEVNSLTGITSGEFITRMCDILDTIGRMAVKELSNVMIDNPRAADEIRDLIILAYRCGMSTEALGQLKQEKDVCALLIPSNELMQNIHGLVQDMLRGKRKPRRK